LGFAIFILRTLTIETNAGRQGKLTIPVGMDAMDYEAAAIARALKVSVAWLFGETR